MRRYPHVHPEGTAVSVEDRRMLNRTHVDWQLVVAARRLDGSDDQVGAVQVKVDLRQTPPANVRMQCWRERRN